MIREVTVLLEDHEKIVLVSTEFSEAFSEWSGPFDVRVADDPYREDYVSIELKKVSNLKRVSE
jgi:hypothetical protein